MAITQLMSLRPMVHKQPRSITSTCSLSMLARATHAHDLGCTARRRSARVLITAKRITDRLARSAPSRETAAAPGAALESASALLPCVGGRHRIAVVYSGLQNQELAYHSWPDDHDHAGSVGRMDQLRGASPEAVIGPEASSVTSDTGIWRSHRQGLGRSPSPGGVRRPAGPLVWELLILKLRPLLGSRS
jgi:hypothetical protein